MTSRIAKRCSLIVCGSEGKKAITFGPKKILSGDFNQNEHGQYKIERIAVYGGNKNLENDAEALESYFMRY